MMLHTILITVQSLYSNKYLALFLSNEKYDKVFDRTRYLIILKSNNSDVDSPKCMKIKINSDGDSPLDKTCNVHPVVILTESVFSKNHNYYYYQVF